MPRMPGTIGWIHSEYSQVIDTGRAESFFSFSSSLFFFFLIPQCANANKQTSTTSDGDTYLFRLETSTQLRLSLRENPIVIVDKNPWRWHTIIKSDGSDKKKGTQPKAIFRKGFVCMAGIYIYIFRARKRLSLLICKSRRDAVSLLIENHRESKNCPRCAFFSNICQAKSIFIHTHFCIPI